MKIFEFFLKTRNNKIEEEHEEHIRNLNINSIEDKGKDFEEKFFLYNNFAICQSNTNYSIDVLFTKSLSSYQKDKIFQYVKNEFSKNINPPLFGLNIRLMFDLATGYKNIKNKNTLKIFIGDIEI